MADALVPDGDAVRTLAAALGDRANELAAEGRSGEVAALWEEAIAELGGEEERDRITLAYAWYQALHGEVEHGVRLAAGLRGSAVRAVRGQVRVLVRNRWRAEAGSASRAVAQVWRDEVGAELPDWVLLRDEDIDAVVEWISVGSWQESEACHSARIAELEVGHVEAALAELALGADARLRGMVAVHQAILSLGGRAGYRSVLSSGEAAAAARRAAAEDDWERLRACATIEVIVHRRPLLGAVHTAAAEVMSAGGALNPVLVERIGALARAAEPHERAVAASELMAIGDEAVAELLALVR